MPAHLDHVIRHLEQGQYELARAELQRVLAQDPHSAEAHALLAMTYVGLHDYDAARRSGSKAIDLAPDEAFAHYALARALYADKRYAKARDVIEQAIRLDPTDADAHWLLAAIHYSYRHHKGSLEAAEHLKAALEAVDQGLAQQPDHPGCANLREVILRDMKRNPESDVVVDALLISDPRNAQTHATKGYASLEDRDYAKAKEHFREALRIDPAHAWAQQGFLLAVKAGSRLYQWAHAVTTYVARHRTVVWITIMSTSIALLWLVDVMLRIDPRLTKLVVLPSLGIPLLLLGLCFLADPIYNLLIRFRRREPVVLTEQQILVSNYVGAALLIAFAAAVGFFLYGATPRGFAVAGAGLLALPIVVTAGKPPGHRRNMVLYTLFMAVVGAALVLATNANLQGAFQEKQADKALAALYILGTLGSAWLPRDPSPESARKIEDRG